MSLTYDPIILGAAHGDHTGDPGRDDWFAAWTKANAMFSALISATGGVTGYLLDNVTSGPVNDYNPGGGGVTSLRFLDIYTAADLVFTGFIAGFNYQPLCVRCLGGGSSTFNFEDTNSAVANRCTGYGTSIQIFSGQFLNAIYFPLPSPRWTMG